MALSSSNDEEKRRLLVGSSSPPLSNIVEVKAEAGMAEGLGCSNEECEGSLLVMGRIGDPIFFSIKYAERERRVERGYGSKSELGLSLFNCFIVGSGKRAEVTERCIRIQRQNRWYMVVKIHKLKIV